MNKYLCCLILLFISVITSAQTYYYQLTKKIVNNTTYTNMAGGQFITFNGNKCYDSDRNGNSVGNGELTYNEGLSDNLLIYTGSSYFGSTTSYRFTSDKSLLNIYTTNGRIYVYRRTSSPSGVYTCSLIKEKRPQPNPFPTPPLPVYVPDPMPTLGGYVETIPIETSPTTSSDTYNGKLSPTQYQQMYQKYENIVSGILRTYSSANSVPAAMNKQTLRDAQNNMRRIREEAARAGVYITQSCYETTSL